MFTEDKMTINERYKYLRCMKKRYRKANRKERSHLLDEMQAVTGLHRKSLIRLIHSPLQRTPRRRQRGRTYGAQVQHAIAIVAESLDYPCPERLTPHLLPMAQHLARHGELTLLPELKDKLSAISISTTRRILARIPKDPRRLPRKRPHPPKSITRGIPMKRISWRETQPGHFETDLVHHSGPNPSGQYVHTLQMVDVATGWSARRAVLGRSYLVMQDAFHHILSYLPFQVLEVHPDNGSEFFNHHLLHFWKEKAPQIQLSRTRPWHKNDNPFVEQKNSSQVRAYLGHERLDTVAQTRLLNQLYDHLNLYTNLFQPLMRVVEKVVIPAAMGQRPRVHRRYGPPLTPSQRLCQTQALNDNERQRLTSLTERTNPRQLRREIYHLVDQLFSLPNAEEGVTENVHDTLHFPLESLKGGDMAR